MKKIILTLILVSFFSCKTSQEIEKPIDYSELLKQAEQIKYEIDNSNLQPQSKSIVVRTRTSLKECQEYSLNAYNKIVSFENKIKSLEEKNQSLENDNKCLNDELRTYRIIKWTLIMTIIIYVLYKLGIFQFIFGLIKKSVFPLG